MQQLPNADKVIEDDWLVDLVHMLDHIWVYSFASRTSSFKIHSSVYTSVAKM